MGPVLAPSATGAKWRARMCDRLFWKATICDRLFWKLVEDLRCGAQLAGHRCSEASVTETFCGTLQNDRSMSWCFCTRFWQSPRPWCVQRRSLLCRASPLADNVNTPAPGTSRIHRTTCTSCKPHRHLNFNFNCNCSHEVSYVDVKWLPWSMCMRVASKLHMPRGMPAAEPARSGECGDGTAAHREGLLGSRACSVPLRCPLPALGAGAAIRWPSG